MTSPTDTVLKALIAQLIANGVLSDDDLDAIKRRLHLAGLPDEVEEITMLPISDAMIDPEMLRSGMHVIDGGNDAP